jgi:hypothetical protein
VSIVPLLLQHRARRVLLHEILEAQRATWFSTGKFDLRTLQEALALTNALPNLQTESLQALAVHGVPDPLPDAGESLNLSGIGWLSARLDTLSEVARIEAVEQAIAMLATREDPTLLANATAIAKTLRNDRDEWTAKLAPLAEWATKHADEISEETPA